MATIILPQEPQFIVGRRRAPAIIPSPYRDPKAWDTLVVGKEPLPGVARVTGQGFVRRVVATQSPGTNGATITNTGNKPRKVKITLTLWNDEQFQALHKLLPKILRQPTSKVVGPEQEEVITLDADPDGLLVPDGANAEQAAVLNAFERFGRSVANNFLNEVNRTAAEMNKNRKTAASRAHDVSHPALRQMGIFSLHFLEADLAQVKDDGTTIYEFDCVDFISPSSKNAGVSTATNSSASLKGENKGWDAIKNALDDEPGAGDTRP